MPALAIPWLRGRVAQDFLPTPAQRAVRVLQVTRANWQVSADGRRGRHHGRERAVPHGESHSHG